MSSVDLGSDSSLLRISVWRLDRRQSLAVVACVALLAILFGPALADMAEVWWRSAEYGYGMVIPAISAFLIWQRKDRLERLAAQGSWWGLPWVASGLLLAVLGELSTIPVVTHYAFVWTLIGMTLALLGWRIVRELWVPLGLLFLMIPLPVFLYKGLSAQLQLLSSALGVQVIRLCDISVHLEGNIIDLGSYQLGVVEACSGLRYLFPLLVLSIVAACFFRVVWWKRLLLVLSSAPITIFMNSFRIGMIGVLVEYGGVAQAEGFMHDFEGWVVFMAAMGLLVAEMAVLASLPPERAALGRVLQIELPSPTPPGARARRPSRRGPIIAAAVLMALTAGAVLAMPERGASAPPREDLHGFPMALGAWQGRRDSIGDNYLAILKLSDYVIADFRRGNEPAVNFYVAYYDSQSAGASAHSPRSCIPGGGWQITDLSRRQIAMRDGGLLPVNRAVVQKGGSRQLVYYWFDQRGRLLTNEYLVKWYLLWDSIWRNRSDGAMVRLTTPLAPGEALEDADRRLAAFAAEAHPAMQPHVPD